MTGAFCSATLVHAQEQKTPIFGGFFIHMIHDSSASLRREQSVSTRIEDDNATLTSCVLCCRIFHLFPSTCLCTPLVCIRERHRGDLDERRVRTTANISYEEVIYIRTGTRDDRLRWARLPCLSCTCLSTKIVHGIAVGIFGVQAADLGGSEMFLSSINDILIFFNRLAPCTVPSAPCFAPKDRLIAAHQPIPHKYDCRKAKAFLSLISSVAGDSAVVPSVIVLRHES